MMERRDRGRAIAAAAALLCGFGAWLAAAGAGAQESSGQRLITVQIAGGEFRIPDGYFLRHPPTDESGTLLIHAFLPDLTPVRGHLSEEFLEKGVSRAVIILAMDASRTTTVDFRLQVRRDSGAPYDQQPNKYGLEAYMPAELGIINKRAKRDELYLEQDELAFTSFITCDIDGLYPAPGCDHTFGYRGLLMQISYRKAFLPEWRVIEQKVKDLLDSFMRQASLSGPWSWIQISRKAVSLSPCMTMSHR